MTYLATEINCDGNKCGECKHQREKTVEFTTAASLPPQYIFAVVCCVHGDDIIIDGNRVSECLAGEMRTRCRTCASFCEETEWCDKVRYSDDEDACQTDCTDNGYPWWQPATKGER